MAVGSPGTEMPYSVSIPMTRRTVMTSALGEPARGGPSLRHSDAMTGMPLRPGSSPPCWTGCHAGRSSTWTWRTSSGPGGTWCRPAAGTPGSPARSPAPSRSAPTRSRRATGRACPLRVYRPTGWGPACCPPSSSSTGGAGSRQSPHVRPALLLPRRRGGRGRPQRRLPDGPRAPGAHGRPGRRRRRRQVATHGGRWGSDTSRIAVAGDSAGGNLAAVAARWCATKAAQ